MRSDIKSDIKLVLRVGMAVKDGLGFTVLGGQLVDGTRAPDWLADLNGEDVADIAAEIRARNHESH